MPKISALSAILALCATQVAAHSWINNPPQRFPSDPNYCLKNDDGSLFVDNNNHNLCGQDAQGIDLLIMRPNSFRENPCYFSGEGTFQNIAPRIVETDSTMCVQWAANSHDTDAGRNLDGGVRISLSTNLGSPSQADFDKMIIANNIPYENFAGAKVKIPALPVGEYVLQYYWSWPVTGVTNGPAKNRLFVSCSNITVVPKNSPRLAVENSNTFPGLGLPAGYNRAPSNWFCNAADQVHGNSSLPNGAGSAAAPTPAPITPAPTTAAPRVTAAPTTAAPTTAAPVAGSATSAPAPTGTVAPVAGRVTITDTVDDVSIVIEPCTATDDITTINGGAYKQKCISIVNNVASTLKFLTIRLRISTEPIVRGLGGMSSETSSARTYNVDLFGGVPRNSRLDKTSSFYYPVGSSASVEFAAHSF